MRNRLIIIIICGVLISLNSCTFFSKREEATVGPQVIEPQLTGKFSDLPVPSGFKFLYKHSYSFQSGNVRMAVFRYSGRKNAEQEGVCKGIRDQYLGHGADRKEDIRR